MTGKEYEIFVSNFLSALVKTTGLPDRAFIKEKQYKGAWGKWRVDISYSFSDLGFNFWVFVECKYWDKVIDESHVKKLHDAVRDCGVQKGIIVSTKGFTKPALDYAKRSGIGIATLSDKNEFVIHHNFDGLGSDLTIPYSDCLGDKYLDGMIYPEQTIYQFLATKIGTDSAIKLRREDFWRYFSLRHDKLEREIKQFHCWIEEYERIAKAGLPLRIPNEFGSTELYFKLSKFLAEQTFNG